LPSSFTCGSSTLIVKPCAADVKVNVPASSIVPVPVYSS